LIEKRCGLIDCRHGEPIWFSPPQTTKEIEMFASAMTFLDRAAVTLAFLLAASPILGIAARAAFI
jgi:hypothetical protein